MPPRQRTAAAKHYRKCACGCEKSVATAAAIYLPGHAPKTVKIEDASGQWILATGISEEAPAVAKIGRVEELDGTFLKVSVSEHATCGSFTWTAWRRGMTFEVRPAPKGHR